MISKIKNIYLRRLVLILFLLSSPLWAIWIMGLAVIELYNEIRIGLKELWYERKL